MSEANRVLGVDTTAEGSIALPQLSPGMSSAPRTLLGDAWRRFRRHRLAMIGAAVLIFFIFAVLIGPFLLWDMLVRGGRELAGRGGKALTDPIQTMNATNESRK
jgi:hypothetical protein